MTDRSSSSSSSNSSNAANYTLTCTLADTHLKAGETNSLTIILRNEGTGDISLDNTLGKYNSDNLPKLDDVSFPNDFGWIFISFSFGDKADDLTTVVNSQSINMRVSDQTAQWNELFIKADTSSKGRYFTIYPKPMSEYNLGKGKEIKLIISDIICNDNAGITPITVQVFISNPSPIVTKLNAEKLLKPCISEFSARYNDFELDTDMTLYWNASNTQNCTVTVDDKTVSPGAKQYVVKVADKDYVLKITDYFSRSDSKIYHPPVKYYLSLSIQSYDDTNHTLTIKWLARNAKDLRLDSSLISDVTGEKLYSGLVIPQTYSHTITGNSKKDSKPLTAYTLTFSTFAVTKFSVVRRYDTTQTNDWMCIEPQADIFVSPEDLLLLETSTVENYIYEPTGPIPSPPDPPPVRKKVRAEWTGQNVDYYEITGYNGKIAGTDTSLDYDAPVGTIYLTAYGKNGGSVSKSCLV